MGRIEDTCTTLKQKGKKIFIVYITAGDPDLSATMELLFALESSGVDIVEIGVPFSDPVADGPTIQAAAERALKKNVTLEGIFAMIAAFRRQSDMPVVLFGYYNPILHYGNERFAATAAASGVDGILVVDLPPEEAGELRRFTDPAGLSFITLIAPTTGPERAGKLAAAASGLIYYISVAGVTGTAAPVINAIRGDVESLKKTTDLPVVIGFGISTPQQAAAAAEASDGVVVGSALVRLIGEKGESPDLLSAVASFAGEIRRAIDAAG